MHSAADIDAVDFRPFFDMVVGILFVLLILIGALLFFQQSAQDETAAREAERNARILETQITAFFSMLANDLRQHGFEPRIDLPNKSISLPMAGIAEVGSGGLPHVSEQRIEDFGRTLAGDLQCLVAGAQHKAPCAPFDRVQLNLASLEVQTGTPALDAVLPQDQFARLLTSEFTAALFRNAPVLLSLSNSAGAPAVGTIGSLSTAPVAQGVGVGGELRIQLEFSPG